MNYSHSWLLFGSNGGWLCYTACKTGSQKPGPWGTCALIRECERRRMRVCKPCKPDLTLVHAIGSVGVLCGWAPASWSVLSAVASLYIQGWMWSPEAGCWCRGCRLKRTLLEVTVVVVCYCSLTLMTGEMKGWADVEEWSKGTDEQEDRKRGKCKVKVEWRGWGTRSKDKDLCR